MTEDPMFPAEQPTDAAAAAPTTPAPPSTDIVPMDQGGFLVLADEEAAEMIAEAAPSPSDLQKLLVPSGTGGAAFTIETLEGEQFLKTIDVVVAYESPIERSFYGTKMGEGEAGPPHCSSPDGKVGYGNRSVDEIAASLDDPDMMERSEMACADCPLSQFGSNLEGGKGQACKQKVRLVVFSTDNLLPMVLQIPAASLKGFKQHKLRLLNGRKRLSRTVTQLSLVKVSGNPDYYTVEFDYQRDLLDGERTKLAGLAQVLADAAASA